MDSVIIYARVSSKEQEAEGYSIPAQLKLLQEYASKNSYIVEKEFTDIETAKKAGRTQFNAMLNFFEENKAVKHILVEKTDRLLRNIADYALLDRIIEHADIKVHLVKENVVLSRDSRSNEKFIFGIKALMAKNYVDNLSEETKKGMAEKAEQGIWPSFAPYGYLNEEENGKRIIAVDPDAAPFIRRAFELYATSAYSLTTLRKKMVADGMVYRNGKNFHKSTLENILKNEFYTGVFSWKGKKYENAQHAAIIDKTLFNQVQSILVSPHIGKSKKGLFPYTNLISCGNCGCKLTAEIKKGKYIYYHCSGSKGKCNLPYIRQEFIEAEFERILTSIRITNDFQSMILQGLRDSLKDKIAFHNNSVSQIEKQINMLQNRIDQAYENMLDKKISEDFWRSCNKKWLEEKERLAIRLLASQRADTHYLENANLVLELAKRASVLFISRNAEQKRRLINLVTSNCTYDGKKIDLELKEPFRRIMEIAKSGKWLPLVDYLITYSFENFNAKEARIAII